MMLPYTTNMLGPQDANEAPEQELERTLQGAVEQMEREAAIYDSRMLVSCTDNVRYFAPRWMRATDPVTGVVDFCHLLTYLGDPEPESTRPMAVRHSDGRVGYIADKALLGFLGGLPALRAHWAQDQWVFSVDWDDVPVFEGGGYTAQEHDYWWARTTCTVVGHDGPMVELYLWGLLRAEQQSLKPMGGAAPGALVNFAAPGAPGEMPAQQAPACRLML
ncbi:hypothetical protein EJ03DRAFT_356419 [Teratosphaeria nubilosa]|uniref:Uncharacterized protein n=1 Tax=Teratosphaeria nubilosa TaxID=161662 RepID=A0A6G1KST2_9PEZI|nr:hypothetical protein EJ03DRAFT_356419 [Teratosphaeria nubilosa]